MSSIVRQSSSRKAVLPEGMRGLFSFMNQNLHKIIHTVSVEG